MRIAVIPARAGSRRIPGKNTRLFHGKPILAYSIEAALASKLFDPGCVWVSTEDQDIGRLAEKHGARWWVRAPELAADEVGTQEVTREVLQHLADNEEVVDEACCIYATAPLLTENMLHQVHELMQKGGRTFAYVEGWCYWGPAKAFLDRVPLQGNSIQINPAWWVDINTEADWTLAEQFYLGRMQA